MIARRLIFRIALFLFCGSSIAYAINPCAGKGTTIVFVNGIFDDLNVANDNLANLQKNTQPSLSEIKNIKYDLAWVADSLPPLQLAESMAQRGVDDFQRYWLWLYGLEKTPTWFEDKIRDLITDPKILNATVLPRLEEHLEIYSDAILRGEQVITVSHSAGSFYTNAALRSLLEYISKALQPSIIDRHRKNRDYPKAEEMIANIQIAPPVRETTNQSPWISFKDDQVLSRIRRIIGALPGNVDSPGVSAIDLRAHSLESYLRVEESRNLLIQHMKNAYARLKYPIPFFQNAATIEYPQVIRHHSSPQFIAAFFSGSDDITTVDEKPGKEDGSSLIQFMTKCRDLSPGEVNIRATSIMQKPSEKTFKARAFIGNAGEGKEKELRITNPKEISRWHLGKIQISSGQGKNPIEVEVKYFDHAVQVK
jgi:hypothetical protein